MSENKREPKLIIVSAPSGCGKGTIMHKVFNDDEVFYSVSCTTRPPRPEDKAGVTYNFLTVEEFEKMIAEDGFLEHAFYSGNYYGTPRKPVEDNLAAGKDVILEIETNGAFQVKKLRPDASSLFILPPSVAELDRRLHKRATEDEETIQKRVAQAAGEIEKSDRYDYVIMNDDLDKAVEDFCAVIDGIRGVKEAAVRFSPENEDIKKMIREVLENA
ncbi:MAG: guanylate kinase [Ruminococcus sp.]|uniref:guanylate kinase n=1 Tax=Ruminococcus sp. TaxID=41978 RepID=UPI0025E74112|nr:guanylate kinase [Ruminococcus sp.]MBR0530939.1 guanylate kinase [Ruminococcus sp.]